MAVPAPNAPASTLPTPLTAVQFHDLAAIPPELEWFANLTNPHTRRAYQQDIQDFRPSPAGGVPRRDPRPRHRLASAAHAARPRQ